MKDVRIGVWKVRIGTSKRITSNIVQALEEFLTWEWRQAVVEGISQPWWSIEHLGIPSPIIRVDMTPIAKSETVKESIYEVEARPAGLGLFLSLVSPKRVEQWREVLTKCKCQGLINIQSPIQDDGLAAEILRIPYYKELPRGEGPYWIRSSQRTGEVAELESISLVPIQLDGDKTYLVKLKMARMLEKFEDLDWSVPFVVKPLTGSKMEGVEIYLPNSFKKKLGSPGVSSKSRILRTISARAPYVVQRFISPQRETIEGVRGWTIWRLFFGWLDSEYQFIGGLWNWRPTLRVHGTSDAVTGLVEMDV